MSKKVVWSNRSKKDLKNIKRFYDQRNQSDKYSKKLFHAFRQAVHLPEIYPDAGKPTDFEAVRGIVVLGYILFYEEYENHILILTVWDCRRDPNQLKKILK